MFNYTNVEENPLGNRWAYLEYSIASHCYLSSSYVKRIRLHVQKINGKVMLRNGLEVEMNGNVDVHVRIQK